MASGKGVKARRTPRVLPVAASAPLASLRPVPGPLSRGSAPRGYAAWLEALKARVRTAQTKAALSANSELIRLYWDIGKSIVERQRAAGWGEAIVERVAVDLHRAFPQMKGFSPRNVWHMRSFYLAWTNEILSRPARETVAPAILQQLASELDGTSLPRAAADIPWFHNVILIQKLKDPALRLWYARKTIEHGWSRDILTMQIETSLHKRQGKAVTNFELTLPPAQSELAQQVLKDPYVFEFLGLKPAEVMSESALEDSLLDKLQDFLLELGRGFCFEARQKRVLIGGEHFFVERGEIHPRRYESYVRIYQTLPV